MATSSINPPKNSFTGVMMLSSLFCVPAPTAMGFAFPVPPEVVARPPV